LPDWAEIAVWDEKKKRLLREVAGLKQTQLQCKRSIHGWREYLQQLDARLAQQSANKESLERHNQHFQRQWQLHLEVRSSFLLNPPKMFDTRSTGALNFAHWCLALVIQPFMDPINPPEAAIVYLQNSIKPNKSSFRIMMILYLNHSFGNGAEFENCPLNDWIREEFHFSLQMQRLPFTSRKLWSIFLASGRGEGFSMI